MDSKERDQRAVDGFSERGDRLYDAGETDERNKYREEKIRKRKEKEKYAPEDKEANELNNRDQVKRRAQSNEYGFDDEEWEDIEGDEEEEDNLEDDEERP
ncbi:MAG: hypothetical protein R6W90_01085 [Ignavibacteriaceae bacterium]